MVAWNRSLASPRTSFRLGIHSTELVRRILSRKIQASDGFKHRDVFLQATLLRFFKGHVVVLFQEYPYDFAF